MGRIKEDYRLTKKKVSPYYYYMIPPMTNWKTTHCISKTEAVRYVKEVIENSKNHFVSNDSDVTFKMYSKDWFIKGKDIRLQRLEEAKKPLTDRYCMECRKFLDDYAYKCEFSNKKMRDITEDDVYQLRGDLLKMTTTSMTNHIMNVVKMVFKYANGKGVTPINPTLFVGSIKEDKKPIKVYSKEEIDRMFDINDPQKMIDVWGSYGHFLFEYLELNSGMRNAEVRCLKWKNVDIKGGQISVEETFKDRKDTIVGKPKNGTNRFFMMSDNLKFVFTEYKEKYAPNVKPTDFVFSNFDGSHWCYTNTKNHHMSGLKKVGVEYRKQHTYRHTFNTILKEGGMVGDSDIRKTLGWADERIQKNYSHMEVFAAHNVATAMNSFWNG